ncbi:MAG: hypothetical protein AAF600_18165 [Bacteroidota bacterium]
MKNEDKVVELLSKMVHKQDLFVEEMIGIKAETGGIKEEIKRIASIQERQEELMYKLLEIMDDGVPEFDQIIDIENLKDGSVFLKRHQ